MKNTSLFVVVLLASLTVSRPAWAPSPPSFAFNAKNNTQATLACRCKFPGETWSPPQVVPPGGEITRYSGSEKMMMVTCDAPVARVIYPVARGKRYSFLRGSGGVIALRLIG